MRTLIVVEDNEHDKFIVKRNLANYPVFDYVMYYDNGSSLIDYLKEHKNEYHNLPDAIFLEVHLAKEDGWDILERLKDIYPSLFKDIKVYIVTSSISLQDKFRALNYNFVERLISKPLIGAALNSLVQERIAKSA